MSFGPLGIWEILVIVGVALLIFGPTQLPKIARGVGKAVKSAQDFKDEVTGAVLDDETPERKPKADRTDASRSTTAAASNSAPADAAPPVPAEGSADDEKVA